MDLGFALAAILALALAGCKSRPEPAPQAAPACPPEGFIEDVHAAAFHFQQGSLTVARRHLEQAQRAAPPSLDAGSAKLLSELGAISARAEVDGSATALDTEQVRAAFGDWPCLTDSLHRRLHERLPPIPGAQRGRNPI